MLTVIGSVAVTEALIAAGGSNRFFLLDLAYLPLELVARLFGELPGTTLGSATTVPTSSMVLAYLVFTVVLAVFVRWRYQRIRVTR